MAGSRNVVPKEAQLGQCPLLALCLKRLNQKRSIYCEPEQHELCFIVSSGALFLGGQLTNQTERSKELSITWHIEMPTQLLEDGIIWCRKQRKRISKVKEKANTKKRLLTIRDGL